MQNFTGTILATCIVFVLAPLGGGCALIKQTGNESVGVDKSKVEKLVIALPTGNLGAASSVEDREVLKEFNTQTYDRKNFADVLGFVAPNESPKGMENLLLAHYQVDFANRVARFHKEGKKPEALNLNEKLLFRRDSAPKTMDNIKDLMALTKGWNHEISELSDAMEKGDYDKINKARGVSLASLLIASKVGSYMFSKLELSHALLTHIEKTPTTKGQKPSFLISTALVDVRSGKIERFTETKVEGQDSKAAYSQTLAKNLKLSLISHQSAPSQVAQKNAPPKSTVKTKVSHSKLIASK